MQRNNYEQMRDKMRGAFLQYDQQKMIDKFHLDHDAAYLYLTFLSRAYRIDRSTGVVTWSDDGFVQTTEADYNESMTIYDVLCYSKDDCRLAGRFCPLHAAKGCASTVRVGGDLFQPAAKQFQGRTELLKKDAGQSLTAGRRCVGGNQGISVFAGRRPILGCRRGVSGQLYNAVR